MESPTGHIGSNSNSDDEIDLLALLGALIDSRWTIIGATFVSATFAVVLAILSTPVYQAGAMLQVEEKAASLPGLEGLSEAFGSESSTQAELEIIKSRSVVGTAVENLSLTIAAEPKIFPVIGNFFSRRHVSLDDSVTASPVLGLSRYGWGGEKIVIDRFDVPSALENREFTLEAGTDGSYILKLMKVMKVILLEARSVKHSQLVVRNCLFQN